MESPATSSPTCRDARAALLPKSFRSSSVSESDKYVVDTDISNLICPRFARVELQLAARGTRDQARGRGPWAEPRAGAPAGRRCRAERERRLKRLGARKR